MDAASAAYNLRLALDMYEVGEQFQRQRLRRSHPDATEDEIEDEIRAWLATRPDAPDGDCSGRVSHHFE